MGKYKWQGEPIKTEFGYCTVEQNKGKPLWWYNYECSFFPGYGTAVIPAIKVTIKEYSFCLANHFGIGHHKLINGGWPGFAHFSFPDNCFKRSNEPAFNIQSFDINGYEEHEKLRRKWEKENFPVEFEKNERLRKIIQK